MGKTSETPVQRLARVVRDRRLQLGLGQAALRPRGGPSVVTVVRIEQAKEPPPRDLTLFALDRSLGWTYGSAERVLAGGEPELAPDPEAVPLVVAPADLPLGDAADALPRTKLDLATASTEELVRELYRRVMAEEEGA